MGVTGLPKASAQGSLSIKGKGDLSGWRSWGIRNDSAEERGKPGLREGCTEEVTHKQSFEG